MSLKTGFPETININMITMRYLLCILALLLVPRSVLAAGRPRGIWIEAQVISVDSAKNTICIFDNQKSYAREVKIGRWARLFLGKQALPMSALKAGQNVRVCVHKPVFGPNYFNRIVVSPEK